MILHQWGIVLEIAGFIMAAVFVGIILTFKSELGLRPFLGRRKDEVARLADRLAFLQWFKRNNAVTVSLAVFGALIYLLGLVFQAISTW